MTVPTRGPFPKPPVTGFGIYFSLIVKSLGHRRPFDCEACCYNYNNSGAVPAPP
jgi:hypothetical protein